MLETVCGAKNKHLLQIGTDTLYEEISWHPPTRPQPRPGGALFETVKCPRRARRFAQAPETTSKRPLG